MQKLIGIDGCKFGWVAVSMKSDTADLFKSLADLINFYPEDSMFMIDMPVGLPNVDLKERNCETIARKILSKKRKPSVFSVPCREAVYALSYEEANQVNKEKIKKGISKQSWGIVQKIREVDQLLQNNRSFVDKIKESHPEVAFHFLNSQQSMEYNKKTTEGQQERLQVLKSFSDRAEVIFNNSMSNFKRKHVSADDILDSICLAVTLEEIVNSGSSFESGNLDSLGIPMKIHYFTK
ncbi:DUF429 domain-containing protein [Chryseobacterium caseinilyticum]|uniref:DUF429 domain-containing protein n=1 Tax=Chryseobacterium caseinilyticum TaxID=2771428 RepID=A0ABR8Z707_9FLAO|nr:DUF429 domain-containing protein [Chryseobacterium caseinilyticum]MBD8081061.1 DUF429 domain-containing protein [Chryseobacterium caseinilyticum]